MMALFSNGYQAPKASPGLNMQHGFVRQIQQHQEKRLQNDWQAQSPKTPTTTTKSIENEVSNIYELPGRGKQLFQKESVTKSPVEKSSCTKPGFLDDEMDLTMKDVDLDMYMEEAQPFIKNALQDPSSISGRKLQNVAEVIVNRAWEDKGYYDIAAKMCHVIFKKEMEQQADDIIPSNNFRNGVTSTCALLMKDQEEFRKHSLEGFMSFIKFMSKAYTYLTVGGRGLQMLVWNIFDGLHILCSPESQTNFEMVELLHSTLHDIGSHLENENSEKMVDLVNKMRDAMLNPQTDDFSRGVLLEILELRASNWQLTPEAATYYIEYSVET